MLLNVSKLGWLGSNGINLFNAFLNQKANLRSIINAGSIVPTEASSIPIITKGTDTAILSGATVSRNDPKIFYLGGNIVENYSNIQPGNYPQNQFTSSKNASFSSTERDGVGTIVEFVTSCPRFEIQEYGNFTGVRLLVNNQISGSYEIINDGSIYYRLFDFTAINTSPIQRKIRLEYSGKGRIGSIKLDNVGSLLTPENVNYSLCWLGDSFIEGGAGTTPVTVHNSVAPYASKLLGIRDYWMSGFGGTGYNKTLNPGFGSVRPSLPDRVQYDGLGADAYVIAMGINDDNSDPELNSKINTTFNILRANNPETLIFVLGPWGNGTGGQVKAAVESVISNACLGRKGFEFISVYDIPFTKVDGTHANAAGHISLGTAVAQRIASRVGATI